MPRKSGGGGRKPGKWRGKDSIDPRAASTASVRFSIDPPNRTIAEFIRHRVPLDILRANAYYRMQMVSTHGTTVTLTARELACVKKEAGRSPI